MKFANYVKEIYVDSDTKVALLSGSPVDDEFNLFLNNDQIIAARTSVNTIARSRRMLAHSIIQPMKRRVAGRSRPLHRDAQARQLEGLHDRRPDLPHQEGFELASRR